MHKGYVIKRILYTIFIFFIVVTLNFFIPRIWGGGSGAAVLSAPGEYERHRI